MTTWDLLIATIPHRHERLCGLLAELDRQWQAGLGVLVYRDNLQHAVGAKRQALLEASQANYVSFVDDDDTVAPDFVALIMKALASEPDYVGFRVNCRTDGKLVNSADHSLRYTKWDTLPDRLIRDFSHLNPIRRELALLGRFRGKDVEDWNWAKGVRDHRAGWREELIPDVMYEYRFSTTDNHNTKRRPWPAAVTHPLPEYPWLRSL